MANVLNKDNVVVWIAPANTQGSELSTAGTVISGLVTSYDRSGFSQTTEQIDVMGGNVASKQPREQFEISMDVVISDATNRNIFNEINMGLVDLGMVALQKTNGGGEYQWEAINNVSGFTFEGSFSADAQWEGSVTFTATAFDENGNHNWDFGSDDIEDASNGLINVNSRVLASGITRTNSWA